MEKSTKDPVRKNGSGTRLAAWILMLLALEGILTAVFVFSSASMEKNVVFLGCSAERLLLGAAVLAACLLIGLAAICMLFQLPSGQRLHAWIMGTLMPDTRRFLHLAFLALSLSTLGAAWLIMMALTPVAPVWPPLTVITERIQPVLLWCTVIPLHGIGVLSAMHFSDKGRAPLREIQPGRVFMVYLVVNTALIQWMTLLLRSEWIHQVGSWFKSYEYKGLQFSWLIVGLFGGAAVTSVYLLLHSKTKQVRNLAALFVMGAALMTGFGFAERGGLEVFRHRYDISSFSEEMEVVCGFEGGVVEAVRGYDAVFGDSFWFETKPPGLVSVYLIARNLLGVFNPAVRHNSEICYGAMTGLLAYGAPLFSFLTLIPVVLLSNRLLGEEKGFSAGVLYIALPNVLAMVMMRDQYLFPLLSALVMFAVSLMLERRSFLTGLAAGVILYLSVFVSFSLLPLLGMVVFWTAAVFLKDRGWENVRRWSAALSGLAAGFFLCWAAAAVLLDYGLINRYQAAFWSHREIKGYEFSISNLVVYGLQDNLEFACWTGLPVYLLMLLGALKGSLRLFRREISLFDSFAASFFLTYVVLHVLGQTRGEVGRIWIFLLPAGVILAAREAFRLMRKPETGLLLVFALQLITADLMYLFMNWR